MMGRYREKSFTTQNYADLPLWSDTKSEWIESEKKSEYAEKNLNLTIKIGLSEWMTGLNYEEFGTLCTSKPAVKMQK